MTCVCLLSASVPQLINDIREECGRELPWWYSIYQLHVWLCSYLFIHLWEHLWPSLSQTPSIQLKPIKMHIFFRICRSATLPRTNVWVAVFLGPKCHQLRCFVCFPSLWLGFQLYPCLVSGHQDWVTHKPPRRRIISHCDRQTPGIPYLHCHIHIPLNLFHAMWFFC